MPEFLITTGSRDKVDRVHRTTCKRAQADPDAKKRNLADPGGRTLASCCKPTFGAPAPAKKAAPAKAVAKKAPAKKATGRAGLKAMAKGKLTDAARAIPAKKAPAKRVSKATATPTVKAKAAAIPDIHGAHKAIAVGADPHPQKRMDLADVENKAAREAKRDGQPKPPTPNADFTHQEYAAGMDAHARKAAAKEYEAALAGQTTRGRGAPTVQYFHDGKACPASQNRFSSLAYWYTRDCDGDRPRITTKALRDLVAAAPGGTTDVENTPWTCTLPNGVVLSATRIEA